MKTTPYRKKDWKVTRQVGRFRVQAVKSGEDFFILYHLTRDKYEVGPCSCGSRLSSFPDLQCHHQRAVADLKNREWHDNLPNRVHFPHPERLSVDHQSEMMHFQGSLRRHSTFGFLDCPHCKKRITKEDLDPDRWPAKPGQPTPAKQGTLAFSEGGAQ